MKTPKEVYIELYNTEKHKMADAIYGSTWELVIDSMEEYAKIKMSFLLDKIERYEKLGFTSEYIHVALKEYIRGA